MSNEQHEDKTHPCRIIGCSEVTQGPRRARAAGWTWACAVHRRMLTLSATERAQLDVLQRLIAQGKLAIDPAGWLTQVAPQPPKPQAVRYDVHPRTGQLIPRFLDTSSPTGIKWEPELDIDSRRGGAGGYQLRDEADDDGQV